MKNTQFCSHCGAANGIERELCFACHHPLDAGADEAEQSAVLQGRYQLIAQIGSGGFGAVYKALDTAANDALIAIKQVNLKRLSPQEIIEATSAFNREVELLSSLSHPQLPRIYDQFSDPEHWYVVMDYIEGQTLEAYLQEREERGKPLTVLEALDIVLQLCNVLRYLHTRQPPIIFRDLKPDNVMRTSRGELYLIDFGIARHFKPGQKRDTIPLGSPGYAAPEQYGRAQTTPQADIYSLGALLHRMLSQIEPSERPLTFVPLTLPGQEANTALNTLLRHMLALVSGERPQSIRDVEYELRHIKQVQIEAEGVRIWSPSQSVPVPPLKPGQQPLYIPSWSRGQQLQMQPQQQQARFSRRRALIIGAGVVSGLAITGNMLSTIFRRSQTSDLKLPLPASDQSTPEQSTPELPAPQLPGSIYWSNTLRLAAYAMPGTSTVEIYDRYIQKTISTFQVGGSGKSLDLYWARDDNHLLIVVDKSDMGIWTPDGSQSVYYLPQTRYEPSVAAWSADGGHIATGGQNHLFIWTTSGGDPFYQNFFQSQTIVALDWSPDNTHLAFVNNTHENSNWTVGIWDAAVNQHISNIAVPYTSGGAVPTLLWSPDAGKWIAYAAGDTLWVLDPVNSSSSYKLKDRTLDATFFGMSWSPDGTRLAIGQGPTIEIWRMADQEPLQVIAEPKDQPKAIGWSLDGKSILTGDAKGNVNSWPVNQ